MSGADDQISDVTHDAFLGGRVTVIQPRHGYRSGLDPVLLAASIRARPGESALELGCGAGAALACLAARVEGLDLHGLELQPPYAALARRTAQANGTPLTIHEGDVADPPAALRQHSFHHVFANPPFFRTGHGRAASQPDRDTGRSGAAPLEVWVRAALRRTRPGGEITFLQRVEQLPNLMAAMQACLGELELLPLAPRVGQAPKLVLLRGRKDARAAFKFHPPRILHIGHKGGPQDYTPDIEAIVRTGAPLIFEGA